MQARAIGPLRCLDKLSEIGRATQETDLLRDHDEGLESLERDCAGDRHARERARREPGRKVGADFRLKLLSHHGLRLLHMGVDPIGQLAMRRDESSDEVTPIMQEGKTPIARCGDRGKFETLADIDRPGTRVIVNPGGTNERFTRAHIKSAEIKLYADNVTIFDEIAKGHADLMITDASETRYQQKLHPGVLCAVHPDQPFDHAQKAYWLQRDSELKSFVDGWLKRAVDDGRFAKIYRSWFE